MYSSFLDLLGVSNEKVLGTLYKGDYKSANNSDYILLPKERALYLEYGIIPCPSNGHLLAIELAKKYHTSFKAKNTKGRKKTISDMDKIMFCLLTQIKHIQTNRISKKNSAYYAARELGHKWNLNTANSNYHKYKKQIKMVLNEDNKIESLDASELKNYCIKLDAYLNKFRSIVL